MQKSSRIGALLILALIGLSVLFYQLRTETEGVDVVAEGQGLQEEALAPVVGREADAKRVPVDGTACIVCIAAREDPEKGVAEAQVRFLRHAPLLRGATVSGEDGTFLLPSAGIYSLVIQKNGFAMLFIEALRCQAGRSREKLLLEKGTRLELSLHSSQSRPSADVDVLLLPAGVRARHGWRRSTLFIDEGVLDQLERALVIGSGSVRKGQTIDIVNRTLQQVLGRNQINADWLPYLASDFHRGRTDAAGLVVWDGIPGDFRWGILSNELTAEMNPPIEGRESRAAPRGGIIPARRMPQNLSGIVKERPGETIRLRAVVNVGNWVKARLVIPKGYRPLRRIMLLSRIDEVKNGQKLVRFVAEHRSEIDVEGVCVFHGVRPGPKVLKAWMEKREVPAYRFYSHAFEYRGGQLDLGRVAADLGSGDAMLGVRVQGNPALSQQITAFDLSLLLVTPKEVGDGHYKLDVRTKPGQLLRLDGQRGRRAYPTLRPITRKRADPIRLKRDMVPIESLERLHWINAEVLSPVLTKVRVQYAPSLLPERSSVHVYVVSEGGGWRNGSAKTKGAWAEYEFESSRPALFAYAVHSSGNGKGLAAGMASFQSGLAKIQLQRGETLDVLVGGGRKSRGSAGQSPWVRLVPESLVEQDILDSPFVKQAKQGKCRFEHIPVPGRYWIFVNDEKRKLIDFNRYLEVDLR